MGFRFRWTSLAIGCLAVCLLAPVAPAAVQAADERILVAGDRTGRELLQALVTDFSVGQKPVALAYSAGTQLDSVKEFVQLEAELLVLPQSLAEETLAKYGAKWLALKPKRQPLASQAVAVIVHPSNRLETLSLEQLRAIYSGKIRDWWTVTMGPSTIQRFGLKPNNEFTLLFTDKVLAGSSKAKLEQRDSTDKVIGAVGFDPLGIGFINVAELPADTASVRVVPILNPNNMIAFPVRPGEDDYPLAQQWNLYVSPRASDTTRAFVQFLQEGGGDVAIRKQNLLPAARLKPTAGQPIPIPGLEVPRTK